MPATLTPEGPLAIPFIGLAKLLAASEQFQEAFEVADAAEALTKIEFPRADFLDILTEPPRLPLAVLFDDDQADWSMNQIGEQEGQIGLSIFLEVPEAYLDNPADQEIWYRNILGNIFLEMRMLANTPDPDGRPYWNLTSIRKYLTPGPCDPSHEPAGTPLFYASAYLLSFI